MELFLRVDANVRGTGQRRFTLVGRTDHQLVGVVIIVVEPFVRVDHALLVDVELVAIQAVGDLSVLALIQICGVHLQDLRSDRYVLVDIMRLVVG